MEAERKQRILALETLVLHDELALPSSMQSTRSDSSNNGLVARESGEGGGGVLWLSARQTEN